MGLVRIMCLNMDGRESLNTVIQSLYTILVAPFFSSIHHFIIHSIIWWRMKGVCVPARCNLCNRVRMPV